MLMIGIIVFILGFEGEKKTKDSNDSLNDIVQQKIYRIPTEKQKEQYGTEDFVVFYREYLALNNKKTDALIEQDLSGMSKKEIEKYYSIFEITPKEIREEIGCQIFKVNSICETYVIHNHTVSHIGFGFGGFGIVTLEACDFDRDCQKDLIYTFSWGSGMHRSHIGLFDLSDMKETWLDFIQFNGDLMLKKHSNSEFDVYTADLEILDELIYSQFKLSPRELAATITADNGKAKVTERNP